VPPRKFGRLAKSGSVASTMGTMTRRRADSMRAEESEPAKRYRRNFMMAST
jgi:hypothetical protein